MADQSGSMLTTKGVVYVLTPQASCDREEPNSHDGPDHVDIGGALRALIMSDVRCARNVWRRAYAATDAVSSRKSTSAPTRPLLGFAVVRPAEIGCQPIAYAVDSNHFRRIVFRNRRSAAPPRPPAPVALLGCGVPAFAGNCTLSALPRRTRRSRVPQCPNIIAQ